MLELAPADGWLSPDALAAAAVSAQMFAFGAVVWLSGSLIRRRGAAAAIHAGFIAAGAGLLLGGVSDSAGLFLLANLAIGMGSGAGFLGIRSLLLGEKDPNLADIGYSHFYSGMTAGCYAGLGIGSALASHVGYQATFLAAAAVMAAAWLVSSRLLPMMPARAEMDGAAAVSARPGGWREYAAFFLDRRVFPFLAFNMIPVYVLAAYVAYYFPVFAESKGMGVGDIGRLLLAHGLLVVYWGPAASRLLLPRLGGRKLVMAAQTAYCCALCFLAGFPVLAAAVAVLVVFGLVEGASVAGANKLFLSFSAVRRLGEERAIAQNEMVGKLGETIGPMAFALAIGLAGTAGLAWLALILLAAVALFALTSPGDGRAA
jgi:predicted MFS family arabinose efflux permease